MPHPLHSIQNARTLRRSSTDVEHRLWRQLRNSRFCGIKFRRQHPVGRYVADFCAPSLKLVIELDGGQHAEREEQDAARTRTIESHGYRVIRFWNSDVIEAFDAVLERVRLEVEARQREVAPHPAFGRPLPGGER